MMVIRAVNENGGYNPSCQICFYLIMLLAEGHFLDCRRGSVFCTRSTDASDIAV